MIFLLDRSPAIAQHAPMKYRTLATAVLFLFAASATATAQTAAIRKPRIGDCTLTVAITSPPEHGWLKIQLNLESVAQKRLDHSSTKVPVRLKGPLVDADRLRAAIVVDGQPIGPWSEFIEPEEGTGVPECAGEDPAPDQRDAFSPSGYVGTAYDNFAPPSYRGYSAVNPADAGTTWSRLITGLDLEGRVLGKPENQVQLWLFGETVYGVRSQSVDCASDQAKDVCSPAKNPANAANYILAHATSLEFYFGPRLELFTFQSHTPFPGKLYVDLRIGYVALSKDDVSTITASHHLAGGLLAPAGKFERSFIEAGIGKTDALVAAPPLTSGTPTTATATVTTTTAVVTVVTAPNTGFFNNWNRFKLDGYLTFSSPGPIRFLTRSERMFVEFYVDRATNNSDPSAVQTFVGVEYDISKLFK
ncbi:MAG: hypothetical protein HY048_19640 [Acidobacteria bacterium]|nr:hypothetical protein [Acidobacteriota bacterium]